jgi:hypothetical protein
MLVKLSPKGREQERQFFLFNDVLIYAKKKQFNSEQFQVKGYPLTESGPQGQLRF